MQTTLTSKGLVTIPRDLSQRFGLKQCMAITFAVGGDHITLRAAPTPTPEQTPGFGLIKSRRKGVPAEFDATSLVTDPP